MATMTHADELINEQLGRLGAQSGEAAIDAVMGEEYGEGNVWISDHVASSGVYPAAAALAALRSSPDAAGWQAAWDAIESVGRID